MNAKLHYVLSITMLLAFFSVHSQNFSWRKIETVKESKIISDLSLDTNNLHVFELDKTALMESLLHTNDRNFNKGQYSSIISIPGKAGNIEMFKVYESSVLAPDLAAKYPNIKSYVGLSTTNSGARLRMSVSPQGVQTMISYIDNTMVFMQPTGKGSNEYILYNRNSKRLPKEGFECKTIDIVNNSLHKNNTSKTTLREGGSNNQTLKKFRIAISTTAEYTNYHDDGNDFNGDAVADALAAINATLNRVNAIFETDMAVNFQLVNAPKLIYTNALTDPYSPADIGVEGLWSSELQNNLTETIGENAYDIGHLFGATGGGGNAGCIGCVCVKDVKGSGYTSPANEIPEGDTFDIDFVAHEIGHQMGANHTFAFDSEETGVNAEPGSGTTIMAYAGIEGANNVALNSDPYFHYYSIKQILNTIDGKCQTTESITNNPPIANAGLDYSIPAGTAYILKGAATDADSGDNLTYSWEQIDSGIVNYLNFGPDLVMGSINRSLPPSGNTDRYIPKLSSVVAGNTIQTRPTIDSDWETVSTVARDLNWALTVRDRNPNNASGAQSSFDTMIITVEDVAPFTIANPINWTPGNDVTINWQIGQTTNASINCQQVNIKLSINGGLTFPIEVASNVDNNGEFIYTVPTIEDTSTARLLIEAADNIFYDVSDFDFTISPEPNFFIVEESLLPIICDANTATFKFNYVAVNEFSKNTKFSVTDLPLGASAVFSPEELSASGTVTLTINNLTTQGNYTPQIIGESSSITKTKHLALPFFNGICNSIAANEYQTSTTLVQFNAINNASSKPSGYSNYTSISTDVSRGSAYPLTVRANTDGDYTTSTRVWIDWNQNCSFDDAGEIYDLGDASNVTDGITSNAPFLITVPEMAVLGHTTMRVTTKFKADGLPTACENGFDGEVEDYTLTIVPKETIEANGFENLLVFPNPNRGRFSIQLNGALNRNIKVMLADMRGKIIYDSEFSNDGDFREELQLKNLSTGMYLLIVNDGIKKVTKKIVID